MNYFFELRKKYSLSRNKVAYLTGLSNSYLQALERGKIKNVGRDKIIAISLALNCEIEQINKFLKDYGLPDLYKDDIEFFISSSRRRQIEGNQVIHHNIAYAHLLLAFELIKGKLVIVNNAPSSFLQYPGHLTARHQGLGIKNNLFLEVMERFRREREINSEKITEKFQFRGCKIICVNGRMWINRKC